MVAVAINWLSDLADEVKESTHVCQTPLAFLVAVTAGEEGLTFAEAFTDFAPSAGEVLARGVGRHFDTSWHC